MLHEVVSKGLPSSIFVHIWASEIKNTWLVMREETILFLVLLTGKEWVSQYFTELG